MPHVIQVFFSSLSNLHSLPSFVAMEGVNDPNPPTQAAKTKKVSKNIYSKPPHVSIKRHLL